jgi:hypothetical protein
MFGSWVNIVSLVQLGPEEVYSAMPVVYSKSTIMIPVRYAATKRYALYEKIGETDIKIVDPQFSRLLIQYQEHPEAKSLAPDGTPCKTDTSGQLRRAHVVAGDLRYIGKETDRRWEEGDDTSVLKFKTTEYGRSKMVVAREEVKKAIKDIGINKCARESRFECNRDFTTAILPRHRQTHGLH